METNFTEQQSLSIINEMIDRARNNVQKGSADIMIFWGYAITLIALLNFVLLYVLKNPHQSFWVWTLCIPCWGVNILQSRKLDKTAIVKTQIDSIISTIWRAFGIFSILFVGIIFALAFGLKNGYLFMLINPMILLVLGVALFILGEVCRFKAFTYGAVVNWISGLCCAGIILLGWNVGIQFLFLALSMVVSFIIPGYLLNKKAE